MPDCVVAISIWPVANPGPNRLSFGSSLAPRWSLVKRWRTGGWWTCPRRRRLRTGARSGKGGGSPWQTWCKGGRGWVDFFSLFFRFAVSASDWVKVAFFFILFVSSTFFFKKKTCVRFFEQTISIIYQWRPGYKNVIGLQTSGFRKFVRMRKKMLQWWVFTLFSPPVSRLLMRQKTFCSSPYFHFHHFIIIRLVCQQKTLFMSRWVFL